MSRKEHFYWLSLSVLAIMVVQQIFNQDLRAQSAPWRRSLPGRFHSVAFNPLSKGRILFAGPYDSTGIYRSDDAGNSWKHYVNGLDPVFPEDFHQIFCVPADTNVVIALSTSAMFRSTNGGTSWNTVQGLGGIDGEDIAYQSKSDILYYGKNYAGPTLKSIDHGETWIETGASDTAIGLCTIAVTADEPAILLAGSEKGVIARSTNEGTNWTKTFGADTGNGKPQEVPKIVFSDYATNALGEHHFAIATRWLSKGRGVVTSSDAGSTWNVLPFKLMTAWALDIDQRKDMLSSGMENHPLRFWVGLFRDRSDTVAGGMVQETTDGGSSWHSANFPRGDSLDPRNPIIEDIWVLKFDTTSRRIAVASGAGIYIGQMPASVKDETKHNDLKWLVKDGNLEITSTADPLSRFEMFDITGRELFSRDVRGTRYDWPIKGWPHSQYTFRITFSSGLQQFFTQAF